MGTAKRVSPLTFTIEGEAAISPDHGTSQNYVSSLAQVRWLRDVPLERLQILGDLGESRRFRKGTYLFQEGDDATDFFVILRGRIELTSTTSEGVERLHSILGPGHAVGEAELLTESPRMTAALAVEEILVWRCRRKSLINFVEEQPGLLRELVSDLVRRMQALDDLIQDLTSLTLKGRVAKALLALALPPQSGPLPRRTVSLVSQGLDLSTQTMEVTQADLAKLCGGTRENVARVLSEFQRRGTIKRTGHAYQLLDPLYLRRVARLG